MQEIENPVRERSSWMDWNRLVSTIERPFENANIARKLENIRRDIGLDALARDVASVINLGKPYDALVREVSLPGLPAAREQYIITASRAKLVTDDKSRPRRYYAELSGNGEQGIKVEVRRNGQLVQTYTGPSAIVEGSWSGMSQRSLVNLTVRGPVKAVSVGDNQPQQRSSFEVGQLPIPKEVADVVLALSPEDIYRKDLDANTADASIQADLDKLRKRDVYSLFSEIKAEMHGRVAYSLSCFLLVSLGAALGLIFRGGQFISAFAIGAIPGAIITILIFSGKNMMESSKTTTLYGMAMIWSGIVILLVANAVIYGRLLRR